MVHDDGLKLGQPRAFVDPATGESIIETPVMLPATTNRVKRRAGGGVQPHQTGFGFVVLNTEALWAMRLFLENATALLLVAEAARQRKMNGGSLKVTSAVRVRYGLSDKVARTAVDAVAALAADTGWVKVHRTNHSAPVIEITDLGIGQIWHTG
jgi:hypothetical protein